MELAVDDVLVVIDTKSVFASVQTMYGLTYRVNYKKLTQFIAEKHVGKTLHKYAYFTMRADATSHTRTQFINYMRDALHYEIRLSMVHVDIDTGMLKGESDYMNNMISDISAFNIGGKYPGTVAVVSGNGAMADLFTALYHAFVTVEVFYFGYSIHQSIKHVSEKVSLNKNMLYLAAV